MAARRLLAVLIALLIVSSLAAALAPQRASEEEGTDTTTTTTEPAAEPAGDVLFERIAADPQEPVRVEATSGDQLELTVAVSAPATVAVPDLGLTGFAVPSDPARFDILLRSVGRFPISVGSVDPTEVGVIVVERESEGDTSAD